MSKNAKLYFVRMFDGFKERKPWSVTDERRFTETVFYIASCDTRAKLSRVHADC